MLRRKPSAGIFNESSLESNATSNASAEDTIVLNEEQVKLEKALSSMRAAFPEHDFTEKITLDVLRKLEHDTPEIDLDVIDRGRGLPAARTALKEPSYEGKWAANRAFQVKVLGFPLIMWNKKALRPSPFKRIYVELSKILPQHTMSVAQVKKIVSFIVHEACKCRE